MEAVLKVIEVAEVLIDKKIEKHFCIQGLPYTVRHCLRIQLGIHFLPPKNLRVPAA